MAFGSSALTCLCTCPQRLSWQVLPSFFLLSVQTPKFHGRDTDNTAWTGCHSKQCHFRHLWIPGGGLAAKKSQATKYSSVLQNHSVLLNMYQVLHRHYMLKSHNCSGGRYCDYSSILWTGNWALEITKQLGSDEAGILNLSVLLTLCCLEVYKVINQKL